jgi:hypothetical protein
MFAKLLKGPPRKVLLLSAFVILAVVALGGRYLTGRRGLEPLAQQEVMQIASKKAEALLNTSECAKYRARLLAAGQGQGGTTLDQLNEIYAEAKQNGCEKRP